MKNRYHPLTPLALLTAAILVASPGATRALRGDHTGSEPDSAPPARELGSAGLQATIGSETDEPGNLQVIEFSDIELNALSTDAEGLFEVHHPNGAVSIDLQGRFQSATVATIGPDGAVQFRCVGSVDEAHAAHCTHTATHRGLEVQ